MNSQIHILLLDDDPMSNLINSRLFEISGYNVKVRTHVDAKEALNLLKELATFDLDEFPNLIFADINMYGMSGWEFAEDLAKFPNSLLDKSILYMLTSSIDKEDISKSESYPLIKELISKPLTEEIVVKYISKLIFTK